MNDTTQILHPFDVFTVNMGEFDSLMTIYSHVLAHPLKTLNGELCSTNILLN